MPPTAQQVPTVSKPEFDEYASEYSRLLQDPIRDRFAGDAEFFHRRKAKLILDFLAHHQRQPAAMSWLDVGCGQGELLRIAGKKFARAVGCDPSGGMIRSVQANEVYRQVSPTELPFPDESFDFVTAVCIYHHVHGADRTLLTRSIHRVLRPGGVFCLIEHNPWNPVTQLIVKRCPVDIDAELLSGPRAGRLVRSAGLKIVGTEYFLYFPEKMFTRRAKIEHSLKKCPLGGQYALFCSKSKPHGSSNHRAEAAKSEPPLRVMSAGGGS